MPQDINPLAAARHGLNITQKQLATAAHCTPVIVTNAENGLYLEPPPAILMALSKGLAYLTASQAPANAQVRAPTRPEIATTARRLAALYAAWVQARRKAHIMHFKTARPPEQCHSFTEWRKSVCDTQYGFCKILVFDPRVIQYYETEGTRGNTLWTALQDVLSKEDVAKLKELPYA